MNYSSEDIKRSFDVFSGAIKKYRNYSNISFQVTLNDENAIDPEYYSQLFQKYSIKKLKSEDELATCFNILRFVNEQMMFRNLCTSYSGKLESDEILTFCRKNRVTLNCALHSIVLSELLISAGIRCRSIQCLPFDPLDIDSHFINLAYISSLNKWIAIDPSYAFYFSDSQDDYINLEKIRQNISSGIDYNINSVARFKKASFDIKWYKAYLAKNLFRFSRISGYRFSHSSNIIYFLEPLGYRELPRNENRKPEITSIFITDPMLFWN